MSASLTNIPLRFAFLLACLLPLSVFSTSGCPSTSVTTEGSCGTDQDCPEHQVCVNGTCFQSNSDGGVTAACNSDAQCQAINPDFVCNASGLCELPSTGASCSVTTDCPIDQFCNYQSQVCSALQTGYCREDNQCHDRKCSAAAGGVGRCVDCMTGTDCPSGSCMSNGVCAAADDSCDPPCETGYSCSRGTCNPVAGSCNPPCLDTEECVQGVCYGDNGCPRHAHPVDGQCACDEGYTPSSAGNACVPNGETCDPDAQLACQQNGGTWDAVNCNCLSGGTGDCEPACQYGTTCQNGTCVSTGGATSCTSSLDCMMSGGSAMMTCDTTTQTCVCDTLTAMITCLLIADDFDPAACDCVYYDAPDAGGFDAAQPDSAMPDAALPDSAQPDAGSPVDAGAASDASTASDAGTTTDAGGTMDAGPGGCNSDSDCASGLCDLSDRQCKNVSCIYDEHCSGSSPHCSASNNCVSAHNCDSDMAYIPFPWDDSMTVSIEGNTNSAYSYWQPAGESCGIADGPEDIYSFAMPRIPKKVVISMAALPTASSWDTHPYVADGTCGPSSLACQDRVPGNQPEVMEITNFLSSSMTIIADGYYSDSGGPYRLSVTVDECDADSDCGSGQTCRNPATDHGRCVD